MAEKVIGFKIQIEGLAGTIETATQLKRQIAELNSELKKTADVDEIKKLEKKLVDLKAAQSLVNDVTREQVKLRKEEIAGIDKSQGAYRKLSKELNDQRNRYKDLAAAQQDNTQEAKDLLVSIGALDKRLKGIDASVGQFQRNVGGYTQALGQFFPKLGGTIGNVTGLVGDLSSGFANLKGISGGLPKGLGAIGIALTAFQGITSIFSELAASANELKSVSNNISNFVQVTDEQLTSLAVKTQTIAETYGKDVNEISRAANTVSKELNVSFSEALDNIEIGFRKGADANNEFLDNLREYPAQFAAAGLSIKEYLAIAIAATNQGIYSDKGLDVVKEFGLRIREQTKTTKEALIDAFGEDFSNSIFNSLNDGSISTADALARITEQMGKTGISGNKLQTVIADVFGAAGEDAGLKFILSLKKLILFSLFINCEIYLI
jgi:phage-related minor tail protein